MKTAKQRRQKTVILGAIPMLVLGAALTLDHIPGTDISLTVPYAAEGPGPTVDTLGKVEGVDVVAIDNSKAPDVVVDSPRGQLNMTTVSVRTNMTLMQALGRWLVTNDTIVPIDAIIPRNHTQEEMEEANKAAFTQSESAATVAAMQYLGKPFHVVVAEVSKDSAAQGVVQEGDVLSAIDGRKITRPQQAQELIRAKAVGDEVTLTLVREGKTVSEKVILGENPRDKGTPLLGVFMSSVPDGGVEVHYNLEDIGGPSAGMMFTLAVIDKLSPGDLTGDHFVAGTGTIEEDGTVGAIGGIMHKVAAAREAGAELFLAPADNCAEAISRDTGDMVVAKVTDLDDATRAMADFAAGKKVDTCGD